MHLRLGVHPVQRSAPAAGWSGWNCIKPELILPLVVAVGAAFRVYDLDSFGMISDAPFDVPASVAHSERVNPFDLTPELEAGDPSQARFPYYLTGWGIRLLTGRLSSWVAFCAVAGTVVLGWGLFASGAASRWVWLLPPACILGMMLILGRPHFPLDDLVAARVIAAIAGTSGLMVAYGLGREVFGRWSGLLAATTLALCTGHIASSRLAVTTGDAYIATSYTLGIWLLYAAIHRSSGRMMLACGIAFGLAVGSKLSGVILWPVAILYALLVWSLRLNPSSAAMNATDVRRLRHATLLNTGLMIPLLVVFFWPTIFGRNHMGERFAVWLICVVVYWVETIRLMRHPWTVAPSHLFWLVFNVCIGGMVTSAFFTPYHLRVEIVGGLLGWGRDFAHVAGIQINPFSDFLDALKVMMIRAGTPVNLLAIGGLLWGCQRLRFHWGGLFLLAVGVQLAAISLMTWKSLTYVLPLIPLVHVIAGGTTVSLIRGFRHGHAPALAWGVVAAACLSIVVHFEHAVGIHPYYAADGHGWSQILRFNGQLTPEGVSTESLRPMVQWVIRHARSPARVAVFSPPGWNVKASKDGARLLAETVRREVIRCPEAASKQLAFAVAYDPKKLIAYDYVLIMQLPPAQISSGLTDFALVYEDRIIGTPSGWVLQRRGSSRPPPPAPDSSPRLSSVTD